MENFLYLIGIIVFIALALFLLSPSLAPMESEYLEFRLGGSVDGQMKAAAEADKFRTRSDIYYSVFSKKPFEADCSLEVVVKNAADLSSVFFSEKLGTKDKMIARPANKINSEAGGEFVINIMKERRITARKVFTISDSVPASAAVRAAQTGEVALDVSKTGEVKVEAAASATAEVKAGEASKTAEVNAQAAVTGEIKTAVTATVEVRAK